MPRKILAQQSEPGRVKVRKLSRDCLEGQQLMEACNSKMGDIGVLKRILNAAVLSKGKSFSWDSNLLPMVTDNVVFANMPPCRIDFSEVR